MGKHSATGWWVPLTKRWILALLIMLSISTAIAFFIRAALDPCDRHLEVSDKKRVQSQSVPRIATKSSPLSFMKSKLVLLVSHELSLSGGPLLLMELAFLLRGVGTKVNWITIQKPSEEDEVVYSLEHKMWDRGVQVIRSLDYRT